MMAIKDDICINLIEKMNSKLSTKCTMKNVFRNLSNNVDKPRNFSG